MSPKNNRKRRFRGRAILHTPGNSAISPEEARPPVIRQSTNDILSETLSFTDPNVPLFPTFQASDDVVNLRKNGTHTRFQLKPRPFTNQSPSTAMNSTSRPINEEEDLSFLTALDTSGNSGLTNADNQAYEMQHHETIRTPLPRYQQTRSPSSMLKSDPSSLFGSVVEQWSSGLCSAFETARSSSK